MTILYRLQKKMAYYSANIGRSVRWSVFLYVLVSVNQMLSDDYLNHYLSQSFHILHND